MGGCAAINCTNSSRKGYRMFRFPTTQLRRKQWILNTRRHNWNPGNGAQLCEDHFEESQFELNRADGWKRLKQNAVPTLIKMPGPPLIIAIKGANVIEEALSQNKKDHSDHFEDSQFELIRADDWKSVEQDAVPTKIKMPSPPLIIAIKGANVIEEVLSQNKKNQSELTTPVKSEEYDKRENPWYDIGLYKDSCAVVTQFFVPNHEDKKTRVNTSTEEYLLEKIMKLEKENKQLIEKLEVKNQSSSFLSEDQIKMASKNRSSIAYLTNESIMECMKLRFALGKFG